MPYYILKTDFQDNSDVEPRWCDSWKLQDFNFWLRPQQGLRQAKSENPSRDLSSQGADKKSHEKLEENLLLS